MSSSPVGFNISATAVGRTTATLAGCLGIFMGGRALLYPAAYATSFGFHPSTSITKSAVSNPFLAVSAGRIISSGLALVACACLQADRAIGILLSTSVVTGLVDAYSVVMFASRDGQGKREPWHVQEEMGRVARSAATGHAVITAAFSAIGAWVLFTVEGW